MIALVENNAWIFILAGLILVIERIINARGEE